MPFDPDDVYDALVAASAARRAAGLSADCTAFDIAQVIRTHVPRPGADGVTLVTGNDLTAARRALATLERGGRALVGEPRRSRTGRAANTWRPA